MMKFVVLLGVFATSFAFQCGDQKLQKTGCFERDPAVFSELLLTYRDGSSEKFGEYLNWRDYENSLQRLACKCAEKAKKEGYTAIALGFYGECHGTKDVESINRFKISNKCINHNYKACGVNDTKCVGIIASEYVYQFPSAAPEVIDGGYSEWSNYTECSETCGQGTQVRERACTNPMPENGGKSCEELGLATETKNCLIKECPVNGAYSEWSDFGDCTKSCGSGMKTKKRTCTNPSPAHGGLPCEGEDFESVQCNIQPCMNEKPQCSYKTTNFDEYSGGEAIYLDRHSLQCPPGTVLNFMKLERNADLSKIRYRYRCCEVQLPCVNSPVVNTQTHHGGNNGKTYFLDRQPINCNSKPISFLKLDRNSDQWNYRYECCKFGYENSQVTCKNKNTDFNDDGNGENIYFDRHTLQCDKDNEFMSYIKLERNNGGGLIKFNYTCCHHNKPVATDL